VLKSAHPMRRTLLWIGLPLLALACAAPMLHAQEGLKGAVARTDTLGPSLGLSFGSLFKRPLAIADFDGDRQPDGALLLTPASATTRSSYRVEVHLSRTKNVELTFESKDDMLALAALDINHDGTTDLVIEQALTHRRLHVWLGDGQGGFRKVRAEDFSATDPGSGAQASAPNSQQKAVAVSLPPQGRFQTTLLISGHISGRPPSVGNSYHGVPISLPSLLVAASLPSRAPPSPQSF